MGFWKCDNVQIRILFPLDDFKNSPNDISIQLLFICFAFFTKHIQAIYFWAKPQKSLMCSNLILLDDTKCKFQGKLLISCSWTIDELLIATYLWVKCGKLFARAQEVCRTIRWVLSLQYLQILIFSSQGENKSLRTKNKIAHIATYTELVVWMLPQLKKKKHQRILWQPSFRI